MTVTEIIETKMKDKIHGKVSGMKGILVLDISGPEGGVWSVDLEKEGVEKKDTDSPLVRIKMADTDFIDMVDGKLNPIMATFSGKIKIEGDMMAATKLAGLFK